MRANNNNNNNSHTDSHNNADNDDDNVNDNNHYDDNDNNSSDNRALRCETAPRNCSAPLGARAHYVIGRRQPRLATRKTSRSVSVSL